MKKSKIQICLIIVLTILLTGISAISYGASFSITSGISTIEKGKTYTISIKASGLTGRFNISHSSNVSVNCSSVWVENGSADTTIKVTAKTEGKATVTLTPESVANAQTGELVELSSKTDTVTVKGKESTTNNSGSSNPSSSKPKTTTEPNFSSRNETVYATDDVNIRASYSTSSTVLGTLRAGESVKRTARATARIDGILWSKVIYNGQTAYISSDPLTTTKPVVKKNDDDQKEDNQKEDDKKEDNQKEEEKKSDNKNLKSLTVTPEGLSPKFSSNVTEYAMNVGASTKKLEIEAEPEDKKAKVSISGNSELEKGENTVEIKVTAEDKTTKTYKIIVTKEEKGQLKLKELLIEGLPLQPEFSSDIYEYKLALETSDVSELNITATPSKENAEVEIIGNTELKVGENVITVLVKGEDEEENATYQITVTVPEKAASGILKNPDLYKYIILGAAVIILLIIIIVLIKKHRNGKEDDFSSYYEQDYNKDDVDIEDANFNQLINLKREEKKENEEVSSIQLDDEEVPKSLRRRHKEESDDNINTNNHVINKIETSEETIARNPRLDGFFAANSVEGEERKRGGKHF